jgi:hypothetical protein
MRLPQDLGAREALISQYLNDGRAEELDELFQAEKPVEPGQYRTLFFPADNPSEDDWYFVVIRFIGESLWVFHDVEGMPSPLPLADRFFHGNLWRKELGGS